MEQLNGFLPSWTDAMWIVKLSFCEQLASNPFLQGPTRGCRCDICTQGSPGESSSSASHFCILSPYQDISISRWNWLLEQGFLGTWTWVHTCVYRNNLLDKYLTLFKCIFVIVHCFQHALSHLLEILLHRLSVVWVALVNVIVILSDCCASMPMGRVNTLVCGQLCIIM